MELELKISGFSGMVMEMIYSNRGIIVKGFIVLNLLFCITSIQAQTEWATAAEPNPSTFTGFGDGLANMGKWLVIGKTEDNFVANNAGAVYVYEDVNGQWSLFQVLYADDGESGDKLGSSVDIEINHITGETWIAAAALNDDDAGTDKGAVYLFDLDINNTGTFIQRRKLNGGSSSSNFGMSLAMNYDYVPDIDAYLWVLAVGDDYYSNGATNAGWVSVYKKLDGIGNSIWELEPLQVSQSFIDSMDFSDRFGASVSVDGISIAAGVPNYDRHDLGTAGTDAGAIYYLVRDNLTQTWGCCSIFTSPDPQQSAKFGTDVEVIKQPGHNVIVMGSTPFEKDVNNRQIGAVYIWNNTGFAQKIVPLIQTGGSGEHFGASIAANGDEFYGSSKLIIGAPFSESDKGIVYKYQLNPAYPVATDFYILQETIVGTNRNSNPWDAGRFGTVVSSDGRNHAATSASNYIGSHRRVSAQEIPIFANGFGSNFQTY